MIVIYRYLKYDIYLSLYLSLYLLFS